MKKKIIIGIVIVLAAVILLAPMPAIVVRDGGSRVYKALTYKVYKYHKFNAVWSYESDEEMIEAGLEPVLKGTRVEILGIKIYDDFNDRFKELYGDLYLEDGDEYYLEGTGDFIPYFKFLMRITKDRFTAETGDKDVN